MLVNVLEKIDSFIHSNKLENTKFLSRKTEDLISEYYTWLNNHYMEVSNEVEHRLTRSFSHAEYDLAISLDVFEGILPRNLVEGFYAPDYNYINILLRYLAVDFADFNVTLNRSQTAILFSLNSNNAGYSDNSYLPFDKVVNSYNKYLRFDNYHKEYERAEVLLKIKYTTKMENFSGDAMFISVFLFFLAFVNDFSILFIVSLVSFFGFGISWLSHSGLRITYEKRLSQLETGAPTWNSEPTGSIDLASESANETVNNAYYGDQPITSRSQRRRY